MDKKILIEYADMKEEIKDLRRRIAEDKKKIEQLNKITVQDSVACGKKGNKPLRTVLFGKLNAAVSIRLKRVFQST